MIDELLRWTILCLGVIYLLTEAAIAAPFRVRFAKGSPFRTTLIYCPACTGFWVGFFFGVWYWPFEPVWGAPLERLAESAVAAMALGAIWATVHRSYAYEAEAEMRGDRDPTQEIEDGA